MSTPPQSAPPYTAIRAGKICILTIGHDSTLTALGSEEVRIRPWENSTAQKWKIESKDGRYGFRNLHTGKCLGIHLLGNVFAAVEVLNNWELFILDPLTDHLEEDDKDGCVRYKFVVTRYWAVGKGVLVRPALQDYLKYSQGEEGFTAIGIRFVDE